jgi:tRNA pseudouridine38-40 synthase
MLVVQYDGTDYAGFQVQTRDRTVQAELEQALAKVLGRPARITASSRTDAGVHALGQVVTLEIGCGIPVANLVRALNDHLPLAVNVAAGEEVPESFHPRYAATGKLYSYRVLNRLGGSPFLARYAWHLPTPVLDVERMREAAAFLLGEHDFIAFRSAGSSVKTTVRTMSRLDIERHGELVEFWLQANGFLYQMARNLVGTLVEVGSGRREPEEVARLLEQKDRTLVGAPAPPQGLCLVRVYY